MPTQALHANPEPLSQPRPFNPNLGPLSRPRTFKSTQVLHAKPGPTCQPRPFKSTQALQANSGPSSQPRPFKPTQTILPFKSIQALQANPGPSILPFRPLETYKTIFNKKVYSVDKIGGIRDRPYNYSTFLEDRFSIRRKINVVSYFTTLVKK